MADCKGGETCSRDAPLDHMTSKSSDTFKGGKTSSSRCLHPKLVLVQVQEEDSAKPGSL